MVRRSRSRTKKGSTEAKLLGALIAALLFFIVSEQHGYSLTNKLFSKIGSKKAFATCNVSSSGCAPTIFGEILHSVVFGLLVLLIMEI